MVQNLKIILIAAASALASAYVVDHANERKINAIQQNTENLNTKIAELQRENAQLNSLLNGKKNTKTTTSTIDTKAPPPSAAQAQSTEQSHEPTPVKQLQDEQLLRTSENFSSWLAKAQKDTGNFNLHEEMQRRFAAESIDPVWAETQEQEYLTLFSQSPELAGLALRETQCRTQQCALTISISDINQANALLEKMTKTLQQKNRHPLIIATPDEQQGITTLYIGKDETSFDFN